MNYMKNNITHKVDGTRFSMPGFPPDVFRDLISGASTRVTDFALGFGSSMMTTQVWKVKINSYLLRYILLYNHPPETVHRNDSYDEQSLEGDTVFNSRFVNSLWPILQ